MPRRELFAVMCFIAAGVCGGLGLGLSYGRDTYTVPGNIFSGLSIVVSVLPIVPYMTLPKRRERTIDERQLLWTQIGVVTAVLAAWWFSR